MGLYKSITTDNNELNIWGSGNQYRDFIFVNDVIKGIKIIFKKGMNKGVIQIGSGYATTIECVGNIIKDIKKRKYNKELELSFDLSKPQGDFGRISINTKAEEMLNFNCDYNIKDGIEILYDWIYNQIKNK